MLSSRSYRRKHGWSFHWKHRTQSMKFEGSKKISHHKIPAIGYLKLTHILQINRYIDYLNKLSLTSDEFITMQHILYQLFDNKLKYKFEIMQNGLNHVLFINSENDEFTSISKLENIAIQLTKLYDTICSNLDDDNDEKEVDGQSLFEHKLPDQVISYLFQYLDIISLESVNTTNRNLSIIARQFSSWHPFESNDIFSALFSIDNLVKSMMGKQNKNDIKNIFNDQINDQLKPLNNQQIEECQVLYEFAKYFQKNKEISEIDKILHRDQWNRKDLKIKGKSNKTQNKIYKILKNTENDLKRFRPKSVEKLECIKKERATKKAKIDDDDISNNDDNEDDGYYDSDNMSIYSYSLTKRQSKPVNCLEINIDQTFIRRILDIKRAQSLKTLTLSDLDKISTLSYLPFIDITNLNDEILKSVMQSFFGNTTTLILKVGNEDNSDRTYCYRSKNDELPNSEVMNKFITILCELPFWRYWNKLTDSTHSIHSIINIKHVIIKRIDNNDWTNHLLQTLIYNIAPNVSNMEIVDIGCSQHAVYQHFTPFLCQFINKFSHLDTMSICNEPIYGKSVGIYWGYQDDEDDVDEEEVNENNEISDELMEDYKSSLPKIKTMRLLCDRFIPKSCQNYLFGINLKSLEINLSPHFVNHLLSPNDDLFCMNKEEWNLFNLTDLKVTTYDESSYDHWFKLLYCPSLQNIELFVKYNQNSHSKSIQKINIKNDDFEYEKEVEMRDNECLTEIAVFEILGNKSKFVNLKCVKFDFDRIFVDEDGAEHDYNEYTRSYNIKKYNLCHIKMLNGLTKMIKLRNEKDLALDIHIKFDNEKINDYYDYHIQTVNTVDNTKDIWKYLLNFTEIVMNLNMSSDIRCRVDMNNPNILLNHFKFFNFIKNNNETKPVKTFQFFTTRNLFDLRW